jgi:transcriptional regulator with XRE-family HTH domain
VKWEKGQRKVHEGLLRALADALDVPLTYLVGETDLPEDGEGGELSAATLELAMMNREAGARIAQRRGELGLRLREVAERIGVTESLVCRWEKGERLPSNRMWMMLLRVLDMNMSAYQGLRDWVAELKVPRHWPDGLKEFITSEWATSLKLLPEEVPLLAAMAEHGLFGKPNNDQDWATYLIRLKAERGETAGMRF